MGVGEVQGQDHPVWSWEGPSRLETWVKHWRRPVITPEEQGRCSNHRMLEEGQQQGSWPLSIPASPGERKQRPFRGLLGTLLQVSRHLPGGFGLR